MLIVFLLICIAMIAGGVIYERNAAWDYELGMILSITGSVFAIVVLLAGIFIAVDISSTPVLKQEIAMYESENAMIEQQVEEVVKAYQKYEGDIFREVSTDNVMTTVTLYPELKSNTLVEKQIEIYISNNAKIKELKSSLLYRNVEAWWLYFGKAV